MRIGKDPRRKVAVEGSLNARYFDYFWAYRKIKMFTEAELIRDNWRKIWDDLPEPDKKVILKFLEQNPSPRMEQENKMKCE